MKPWLGGLLGWWLGGPWGAAAGVALTALWNRAQQSAAAEPGRPGGGGKAGASGGGGSGRGARNEDAPGVFAVSMMTLVAAVMKADGRATKVELQYVKGFLRENFSEEFARSALGALRELLKAEATNRQVAATCRQVAGALNYSQRLELLHLLYGVAWADGVFDAGEERLLGQIGRDLGIGAGDAASIAAMFRRQNAEARGRADEADDYRILGIEKGATDEEVRKAYRRMAMKCHPDKVAHLGPEFQRDAEAKFRRVNEAYERIKKARGK
jgi:DnaJ like chaperone protein